MIWIAVRCPRCASEHLTRWWPWCKSRCWHVCAVCNWRGAVKPL